MRIAVTATGPEPDAPLDTRFGRTAWFVIYDTGFDSYESVENKQNLNLPQGAGIQSAALVVNSGSRILISAHCGPKAYDILKKGGVQIFLAADGTVRQCLEKQKQGFLKELKKPDVEGHW